MEISLQKTETMVLDPRRSKAAQHSRGGSIQSASQPTAIMPLLSLLLIAVLAIALPLPPAVCIIAATGLCCCVLLVRLLLTLSYSLSSHSPPLPAAIPISLPPTPPALHRQQPAANHHHKPPNAQPQLQGPGYDLKLPRQIPGSNPWIRIVVNLGRTRFFPDSGFFHPVRRSGVIPITVLHRPCLCLYAFCRMYSLLREPGRHS